MNYNGYGPPGGFCFDIGCNDQPIMVLLGLLFQCLFVYLFILFFFIFTHVKFGVTTVRLVRIDLRNTLCLNYYLIRIQDGQHYTRVCLWTVEMYFQNT